MSEDAVAAIEQGMVAMRRSWSRRRLQRRAAGAGATGPGSPRAGTAGLGVGGAADPGALGAEAALFQVLDAIEGAAGAGGTMTVNGVADALGVDQPRASRLVARAVEAGLVSRGADPADGRRSVLGLTPAGTRVMADGHRTRRAAVEAALAGWSAEDRETFARLLRAYVAAWEAM
jgi:DNA-binding MarR family transcriptional regulator